MPPQTILIYIRHFSHQHFIPTCCFIRILRQYYKHQDLRSVDKNCVSDNQEAKKFTSAHIKLQQGFCSAVSQKYIFRIITWVVGRPIDYVGSGWPNEGLHPCVSEPRVNVPSRKVDSVRRLISARSFIGRVERNKKNGQAFNS